MMDSSSHQETKQEGNLELQSQPVQRPESVQSYSHDPSRIHASDSSYPDSNGYIQQYGHHYESSSYYYLQHNAYYNPQPSQPGFHGETTSILPPGVPIHPQSNLYAPAQQAQLLNWQNTYQPHGNVANQGNLDQISALPRGLNPSASAAVMAFTQLSQFAASMDAVQRAGQQQIRPSPYNRGGGRRGSRPFKGGGRAHFGHHGSRSDNGSTPPFRGRARGRGGSTGHLSGHDALFESSSNVASFPTESGMILVPQSSDPGPVQVLEAPHWPPPRLSWCELCRVNCNTPEILEQHKNGKRHKKTLKTREELQRLNKVISGEQSDVIQSGISQGFEENLTSKVVAGDSRNRNEQPRENLMNSEPKPADRGSGLKRKKKAGQGGKRIKTNEGSKSTIEPFFCDLCNVKCESQVVFDTHLSGKKHLAILKGFHGHKALYGEERLKELYPQNLEAASTSTPSPVPQMASIIDSRAYPANMEAISTLVAPLVQQTVSVVDPQALLAQLLMTVISQVQAPASQTLLTGSSPAPMEALAAAISAFVPPTGPPVMNPGPISEPQNGQSSEIQQPQTNLMVGGEIKSDLNSTKTGSGEAEREKQSADDERID